jgi:4'-phosphopantetheinyl transferase
VNWNSLIGEHETLPALTEDSVHVWRAFTSGIRLEAFEEILSWEEEDRADRFYFERDRRAFVAFRGILRRLISLYTGEDAARIRFEVGPHGKLFLARSEARDLRFNVSHSGEMAYLAFAWNHEIGVDVEYKRAGVDFVGLSELSFSEAEHAEILATSHADRANLFYEFWSCKEACIKADGRGLSVPLDHFSVNTKGDKSRWREIVCASPRVLPSGLRTMILEAPDDYAAAMATTMQVKHLLQRDLDYTQESVNQGQSRFSAADRHAHLVPGGGEGQT